MALIVFCACIAAMIVGSVIAYRLGRQAGRRAAEEDAERMRRILPPDRTAGLPTNLSGPPSTPRKARWSSGEFKAGPPQR